MLGSPPPAGPTTQTGNKQLGPVGEERGLLEKWPRDGKSWGTNERVQEDEGKFDN